MNTKSLLTVLLLVLFGCTYHDTNPKCYHGNVIMSSCCSGSTFIAIDSHSGIGKPMKVGEIEYQNVIQIPNYFEPGPIFLKLRNYDPEKDASLFPIHCNCFIPEALDVPLKVAIAYSFSDCPMESSRQLW